MPNLDFSFDYPIIIKRVGDFLTVSNPDLGINEKHCLLSDDATCDSIVLTEMIASVVDATNRHLKYKAWKPSASSIKESLVAAKTDLSLPEFCTEVRKHFPISENTVRREINKGAIVSLFTSGGHRRIPTTEVNRYLNSLKNSNQKQIE